MLNMSNLAQKISPLQPIMLSVTDLRPSLEFRPGDSLGLEKNSIESSLDSAALYIQVYTICPCLFYKYLMSSGSNPVHVIFLKSWLR